MGRSTMRPTNILCPSCAEIMSTSSTITNIVVGSADFDILESAVITAGLAAALDDPTADLTVFAPNDAAFVGLAQTLGFTGTSESEAFAYLVEALTLLSGGSDPVPLLTDILLYHVAPGSLFAADVLAAESITTLLGADVGVSGTTLVDGDQDLTDPNIIAVNVEASNGVVHVIDGVLIPVDVLASDGSNDVDFIISGSKSDRIAVGLDNDYVDANGGGDVVNGGAGNDVIMGGTGADQLIGGSGNDILRGESGADDLRGNQGDDLIDGGAGNDRLSGAQGRDVFVFESGYGRDFVSDFVNGQDKVDLTDYGFESYSEFRDEAHLSGSGNSVVINFEGGEQLTLKGIKLSQIDSSDFILV